MKKRLLSTVLSLLVVMASFSTAIMSFSVLAESNELLITDCETLTGWAKTGGNALSINSNGFGTGSKAVACDISNGAFRTATYTSATTLDISKYKNIQWDVMMHTGAQPGMWDDIKTYYGE